MTFLETQFMQRDSNIFRCIFQRVMIDLRPTKMEMIKTTTMKLRVILLDLLSSYHLCLKLIKIASDSLKFGGKITFHPVNADGKLIEKKMQANSKASKEKMEATSKASWMRSITTTLEKMIIE